MLVRRRSSVPFWWLTILICFYFFFLRVKSVQAAASGSYGWTYAWTRVGGGTGNEFGGQDIAVDTDGNVLVTGGFEDTVNFDGTGGSDNHTASGSYADIYITKYNANGSY